jgi:hypothetical protein
MKKCKFIFLFASGFSLTFLTVGIVLLVGKKPIEEVKDISFEKFVYPDSSGRLFSSASQETPSYEFFETTIMNPELKQESAIESINKIELPKTFVPIKELKKQFDPGVISSEIVSSQAQQEKEDIILEEETIFRLTDEEYFSLVYPESYVEYLNDLQDLLLEDGYITEDDKTEFKTEKDSYAILIRFVDYMANKGYIDKKTRENLTHGFTVELPELNKQERPVVEKRLLGISWHRIIDEIAAFLALKAHAVIEVDIAAECYRMGVGGPIGFNSGAFCCNCGFSCNPSGCWFVPNCGPMGGVCNAGWHLGCLNAVCMGRPAIWDPMTGICGCG